MHRADRQRYGRAAGRNSNGQAAVTISNLELRLPVVEPPDCDLIEKPAPKVLPAGYTLAADFVPDPGSVTCDTCPREDCALPSVAGKSRLVLKDKTPDHRDRLLWKLGKGPLVLLTLPILNLPLTVQLVSGDGPCWETPLTETQRNLPEPLKAK